jgi:hypothetical protein
MKRNYTAGSFLKKAKNLSICPAIQHPAPPLTPKGEPTLGSSQIFAKTVPL